jgi:hypothetical protein
MEQRRTKALLRMLPKTLVLFAHDFLPVRWTLVLIQESEFRSNHGYRGARRLRKCRVEFRGPLG